jgi:CRISP-associated protein Cas1
MFSNKDIEFRSIFVINCIENRNLRVSSGELLLENEKDKKTITKLPFQKILALFIIGHITITTPLIEKCKKFDVALVVMKPNLRLVFFYTNNAEANYLLKRKQYFFDKDDISIAKILVSNKIHNQLMLLNNTKKKDDITIKSQKICSNALLYIKNITDYNKLMGIEGVVSKNFFMAYFQELNWHIRAPRTKIDAINVTLDIGYTILFNYIEVFVRMFGFDVYCGVYHRLWFKRKSLICDLMEPFRCIIDNQVRKAFNKGQCKESDFILVKNEYKLKFEKNSDYYKMFYEVLIEKKMEVFKYIQSYYRCFMRDNFKSSYPFFDF